MHPNAKVIQHFYKAFSTQNVDEMAKCYHKNITFQDPGFGHLAGKEVLDMWEMLLSRSKGQLKIEFQGIVANDTHGKANWKASYVLSKNNRKVVNYIRAKFEFQDGLIIHHEDHFDLWKWSQQAFGWKGYVLGWSKLMKTKIQGESRMILKKYQEKKAA